jgi:hypothetical protein
MVRIIHISDSHNNSKAVEALHRRLSNESKCDVIAHTGDIENTCTDRVPHGWNDWPQKHKLSVPGNHDTSPGLFDSWTTWITKPPYALAVQDLLFVGLSRTSEPMDFRASEAIQSITPVPWCCGSGSLFTFSQ